MKKLSIVIAALTLAGAAYGAQLEIKGGYEPWREGNHHYSEFDQGGSLGMELLLNAENHNFDYGIGAEWKSDFAGGDENTELGAAGGSSYPIYLTGKYGIGDSSFYVVGRVGYSINESTNDGFYGAAGLGKTFGKHFTLEALYESMDMSSSNNNMYSDDRAQLASIKFGYRFGENKRDAISREKDAAIQAEYEKQQADEAARLEQERKDQEAAALATHQATLDKYNNFIVASEYSANDHVPSSINQEFLDTLNSDLANESGTLYVRSYTDDTGSEATNLKISQKRADAAAEEIKKHLTNENIKVVAEGKGETNFLNDNANANERRANRRIEVTFEAE